MNNNQGSFIVLYHKGKNSKATHCINKINTKSSLFLTINNLTSNKININDITVLENIGQSTFKTMDELKEQTINFLVEYVIIKQIFDHFKFSYPLVFMDYFFCDLTMSIATDGKRIMINPDFILKTTVNEIKQHIIHITMLAAKLQGINNENYDNEYTIESSPVVNKYKNQTFYKTNFGNTHWEPNQEKEYMKNILEFNHDLQKHFLLNLFDNNNFDKLFNIINDDNVNNYFKVYLMKFFTMDDVYKQQVLHNLKDKHHEAWRGFVNNIACYFFD